MRTLMMVALIAAIMSGVALANESASVWQDTIGFVDFRSEHHEWDMSRIHPTPFEHVQLYFTLRNMHDRTINGIEFQARFLNAFGDVVHTHNFIAERILQRGEQTPSGVFFYFDGLSRGYDNIASSSRAGTLTAEIAIQRIVFGSGEIRRADTLL